MKRIYLAGPAVFFGDRAQVFEQLKALCTKHNVLGVSPLDGEATSAMPTSSEINLANIQKIHDCDGVLADLRPFRGKYEPDSGTCFELGYACALGKPGAMYLPKSAQSLKDKIGQLSGYTEKDGELVDNEFQMSVEDFGNPLNLMLSENYKSFDTAEEALIHLIQCISETD